MTIQKTVSGYRFAGEVELEKVLVESVLAIANELYALNHKLNQFTSERGELVILPQK